jgi:hypothetical protein
MLLAILMAYLPPLDSRDRLRYIQCAHNPPSFGILKLPTAPFLVKSPELSLPTFRRGSGVFFLRNRNYGIQNFL